MRYLKQTMQYLFVYGRGKRYLLLFLVCLFPAAMFAFGFSMENVIGNFIAPPAYHSWGELWLSYFPGGWMFFSLLLGTITIVLSSACIIGAAIRHFRIGVFTMQQLTGSFNDYFLPSVWYTLFHVVLCAMAYTLFTVFAYMYYVFLTHMAYTVLCFVTGIIFLAGVTYIVSSVSLWYPGMCIKGDYTPAFFFRSFYNSRVKQKYFLPGHILSFSLLIVTAIVAYFTRGVWYVPEIVTTIGIAAAFAFSIVYVTVVYFGENCLPREDLNRRYL